MTRAVGRGRLRASRARLGCSGCATTRGHTPPRLARVWPWRVRIWACRLVGLGAHLLGVVDGFSERREGLAVALAGGVAPVGKIAAVSLQHLGSLFSGPLVWCGPVVAPQVAVSSALAWPSRDKVQIAGWRSTRWTASRWETPVKSGFSDRVCLPLNLQKLRVKRQANLW